MKTITKDLLIAAKFASKDTIRPQLAAVRITENGYVATDSYKLIMIKSQGEDIKDFPTIDGVNATAVKEIPDCVLIPAKDVLAKLKFPKNAKLPILETALLCKETDKTISIATTDLETASTLQFHKIDAKYPEFKNIVPTAEPLAKIKLDAGLLIECLQAFTASGGDTIQLEFHGATMPLIVTGQEKANEHIKTLLMPKR